MSERTVTGVRRTLQEIRGAGAAWVTEAELAWLCDQAELLAALDYNGEWRLNFEEYKATVEEQA